MSNRLAQAFSGLFADNKRTDLRIDQINQRRSEYSHFTDEELRRGDSLIDTFAAACVAAERVLGMRLFDVQIQGALALADGKIAEMQTGEGKTLAAVPAVVWYARARQGVHVLTANDYLAQRDAQWMGDVYRLLGLSVGYIAQGMAPPERRHAYACEITYAMANEVGFDYLRDQLCLHPEELVHRPFGSAVIDEADSILIDEARVPLVIAGGKAASDSLAYRIDAVVRGLVHSRDFTVDDYGRNVVLTDAGITRVENSVPCGNLYEEQNMALLTAVQDALHAHVLLRRNVDYLVKNGIIELVDEFKGRIAQDRRWPAGLHAAIEAKEGVALKTQGVILGSITLQNLIALYPKVCGMTGTAKTQEGEFQTIYKLAVDVIPTNQPMIRGDHEDVVFPTKSAKHAALIAEIAAVNATGRPILVGTASVEESEDLSRNLDGAGVPHHVLNARNDEQEAAIIAQAGALGAVTISTNMAGRGTDIQLGGVPAQNRAQIVALGGLYVIGTNKHESRRIDNQLRGRAGRQGDPGSSRFFISLEDDLLVKYGIAEAKLHRSVNDVQRLIESQNLEIRQTLHKYESVIEHQRRKLHDYRRGVLLGETPVETELERLVTLTTIDDLWSEYLAAVADIRAGIHWVSWGGRNPLHEFLTEVVRMYAELEEQIDEEIPRRLAEAETAGVSSFDRGATWTYLTTDQPFGTFTERIMKGIARKIRSGKLFG